MDSNVDITPELEGELLGFAQALIQTQSLPGQEEAAIRLVERRMQALGYDEVVIDSLGNVLGRIGAGPRSILFDSHVDTVAVNDAEAWDVPPFGGEIRSGRLHGRGAVDMKGALAAAVYAGTLAKRRGLTAGKTVYVSGSVFEEDCDGENLKHLFRDLNLRPDCVVICEPSENQIAVGHKGKIQVVIKTQGVSAHGSAPEQGQNAVYEMAEIIQRVEQRHAALQPIAGRRGTLVLSRISSTSASLNAVPSECEIYLDRRLVPGETKDAITREMEQLIEGKRATWAVGTLHRTSWTGKAIRYEPFHLGWEIARDHDLTRASEAAYRAAFGQAPAEHRFWDFSTNAVTPVSLGIPTIGFGPGDPRLAHRRNEYCPVDQIVAACRFYTHLIQQA